MRGYGQLTKKSRNIINKITAWILPTALLLLWWAVTSWELVPAFLLPSPAEVVRAFVEDLPLLGDHLAATLSEAFWGLLLSIIAAVILAVLMDEIAPIRRSVYPLLVVTQTIPSIAIAPLLVLWLGYDAAPKIALIFITCFFPIAVSLLSGLSSVDGDMLRLFRSMGATRLQTLLRLKLPAALESFFSGLRVAVSYSIVGAVIAEWLGGDRGLGVYMTRVRKSFAFDKMFAVIILISAISLLAVALLDLLQKASMPWKRSVKGKEEKNED